MKARSLFLLFLAQVTAMSVWFVSAAILPEMLREFSLSSFQQAALSSSVQAGFVVGALVSSFLNLPDRYDPRYVFAICAIMAGVINALLLLINPASYMAIVTRFMTGALLAGVYPVGMKIAIGWGRQDRGFLVGALVGALTLGSASPHLIAFLGGTDWRLTVALASAGSVVAGLMGLAVVLGPYHARAARFDPKVILQAWYNRRVRLAYAGYLGHMWELYAMWAWIGVAAAASYGTVLSTPDAEQLAKLTAFLAIAIGGVACVFAGRLADRIGKAEVTILAMSVSGLSAIMTALTFGGPVWLTFLVILIWGLSIIPDSAQFSALVADTAPPEHAGSLMTFQTALGFTLTFFTVQITPMLADAFGWPIVLASLALGPAFGIAAMMRLRALGAAQA